MAESVTGYRVTLFMPVNDLPERRAAAEVGKVLNRRFGGSTRSDFETPVFRGYWVEDQPLNIDNLQIDPDDIVSDDTDCRSGDGLVLWETSGYSGKCLKILKGTSVSNLTGLSVAAAHSFEKRGGSFTAQICGRVDFAECVTAPNDFGPSDHGNLDIQPAGIELRTVVGPVRSVMTVLTS